MTARKTTLALAAVALMVFGCTLPWAQAQVWNVGPREFGPLAPEWLTVLIGSIAIAALSRHRYVTRMLAMATAGFTALIMSEQPGNLVENGAWEAHVTLGAFMTLAGAIALVVVTRPARGEAVPWVPVPFERLDG